MKQLEVAISAENMHTEDLGLTERQTVNFPPDLNQYLAGALFHFLNRADYTLDNAGKKTITITIE